jgi:hypothetical protein
MSFEEMADPANEVSSFSQLEPITQSEITMDVSRCARCRRRMLAMADQTGRTTLVCLECDNIDPMKTDALAWANSSLGGPR